MAKTIDYEQLATDIVRLVGGPENVKTLGHCMTRLRFILHDESKADKDAIDKLDGVLGVVSSGGQFMVILGQNLLPVFEAANKKFDLGAGEVSDENLDEPKEKEPLTIKSIGSALLGYVSASVTPMITGLVAGGMLKVALLLVTLVLPDFSSSQTYTLLYGVADAAFYFMPIYVAYGAATKLGGTPIYSMIAAAALLHTNYTGLVSAGETVTLFGVLPVALVSYSSTLLPALLIAPVAYYLEKFFNKVVPGIFKSLLVGLCTITVTMILGYVILGPLGSYLGSIVASFFMFIGTRVAPLAIGLLAACLPWLVMCGMHASLAPFMAQLISDPGYDSILRPAFILHNMSEGGACLGVGLRTKNIELRSEAFGLAFGCIVAGVTEPALYGINLRKKKPMYGVMAGGAVGGVVAGIVGVRAYTMGYSTILALPIFEETIVGMAIACVVSIVVSAAVTYVLGFEDDVVAEDAPAVEAPAAVAVDVAPDQFVAPVEGTMVAIESVADPVFSSKAMGDGVAFVPASGTIVTPCSGTLNVVAETGHAFGITREDGVEVLIHVGIDTVNEQGAGFEVFHKPGDVVRAGEPVVRVDLEALRKKGYDMTTMLIILDDAGKQVSFQEPGDVAGGAIISL